MITALLAVALAAASVTDEATFSLEHEIRGGEAQALTELARWARKAGAHTLVVTIDSPGGDAGEAISLYRALRDSGLRTRCEVRGLAASGAFLALQGCDVRLMSKGARLATHRPIAYIRGPMSISVELAKQMSDELTSKSAVVDGLIAARLGMTLDAYRVLVANGGIWTMDLEAALRMHAIDGAL